MIEIHNKECLQALKELPDNSVDFITIDPPYTDGKGNDVLAGHKIQTVLDLDLIAKELYRVAKPNTFYAFFGQMPTIISWYNAAVKAGFKFRIDIVWAKKKGGLGGNLQLKRSHELIYICSKGNPNYAKTKGIYSDVSQALIEYNLMDIETIFRRMSEYEYFFKNGKERLIHNSNTKVNDNYFYEKIGFKKKLKTERAAVINEKCFNSFWAFATHNTSKYKKEETNINHPTVKPIPLLERLIELCTPEDKDVLVLDCFLGSGTTALACQNTNRNFLGFELDKTYYEICLDRIEKNRKELEIKNNVLL
jgi:site-specific DNA-methyltransferase (adenine-specific)